MDEDYDHAMKVEKRRKDKADTATVDKVLDPKTMRILERLVRRQKLFDLGGAFSSGKEANVYTARCSTSLASKFIQRAPEDDEVVPAVLKIYKTSTMLFRDRARYIIDVKRFKRFCVSNTRKLIKLWSEKEVRNLRRLEKHGILCPRPLYLKRSILIMSMIGDTVPSPRLKDADVSDWDDVYLKSVQVMKDMYQKARLIHADFSEYNLIYHHGEVYVIDVSQSMDAGQENSNAFLMMDICNCNEFFSRKGVSVRSDVEIFEEITGLRVPEYLRVDGRLSMESFIPSRATEVANIEDLKFFVVGYGSEAEDCTSVHSKPSSECESSCEASEKPCSEDSVSGSDGTGEAASPEAINVYVRRLRLKNPDITEQEEKALNKQRKMLVKQMNRERRARRVQRKEEHKGARKRSAGR